MGYFVDADGTVRSEESVREEIEENLKKVNNLPLSSEEKEQRQLEANIKKNIVTTEFTGTQQKEKIRSYCPVCCKWICGNMLAHMNTHIIVSEIKCKERQKKESRKVVVRSISIIEETENKKITTKKAQYFKKRSWEKFLKNKRAGFTITIEKLYEIYKTAGGKCKGKKFLRLLELFVSSKKELKFNKDGTISVSFNEKKDEGNHFYDKTDFVLEKKKNKRRKNKSKVYQYDKGRKPYTATITDITGCDTHYANKGDYRFRDSNGQFGSTPLYDDYDN